MHLFYDKIDLPIVIKIEFESINSILVLDKALCTAGILIKRKVAHITAKDMEKPKPA